MAPRRKTGKKAQPRARRTSLGRKKANGTGPDLKQQLAESRAQQAATAEILKVIARSPSDTQPVFDAIVKSARRLFGGYSSLVTRIVDGKLHIAAMTATSKAGDAEFRRYFPAPISGSGILAQAILKKSPIVVNDTELEYSARVRRIHRTRGYRSVIAVPLLRDGIAIGTVSVSRREPGAFAEHQIELLKTFADQAVIAIENARAFNETKEALERQTATSEVLKTISRSTFDLNAVLQVLIENATRLAGANQGFIFRMEGKFARLAYSFNAPPEYRAVIEATQFGPGRGSLVSRVLLEQCTVHLPDALADAEFTLHEAQRLGGFRSMLGVPMLREGNLIGVIAMWKTEVRPFTEKQMELVSTFADQAVIAIENVRLFNETREALERQTATAEILSVIASSPSDVQPVFDAIVASARRLLDGRAALVARRAGDKLDLAAYTSINEAADAALRALFPAPITGQGHLGKAILAAAPVQVGDFETDEAYSEKFREMARARGLRSALIVPMLLEGEPIGVISVNRSTPGGFSEHQTNLLRTFADQAVIAVENVRLFNETKEALERQTATADILKVISSSLTDTQPVFDAIVQSALRLFSGHGVGILLVDGDRLQIGSAGGIIDLESARKRYPVPLNRDTVAGQAILGKAAVNIADTQAPEMPDLMRRIAGELDYRAIAAAPMLREGAAIGAIAVLRKTADSLREKELALLQTFADQAVIAIENVRLFNETRESLERQTATAEILSVIASSPTNVQPVFEAIVRSGMRLFSGAGVGIGTVNGDEVVIQAAVGMGGSGKGFRMPLSRESASGLAILERKVLNIPDTEAPGVPLHARENGRRLKIRSMTQAPMFREGEPIGSIGVMLKEPGGLDDKQLALLRTFADQAVIAIENVRLFNETKEALERQTVTAEILKVIASSPADVQPVFEAIAQNAHRLFGRNAAFQIVRDGALHLGAAAGYSKEETEKAAALYPMPLQAESSRGQQAIREGRILETLDVEAAGTPSPIVTVAHAAGFRSIVTVPLLRGDALVGNLSLTSASVRQKLDEKQLGLLKTFADQAVIAIENVRLFNETKEALERQTATAEILKVIASSPTDVQPVFDVIAERAVRLCGARFGRVYRYDGSVIQMVAGHGLSTSGLATVQSVFPRPASDDTIAGRVILTRQPFFLKDVERDDTVPVLSRQMIKALDTRSQVTIPMLRAGESIGAITMGWDAVDGFDDQKVALLKTFADQAVIAIENVRLFNETKEALERQTATSGILEVMSGSPTDVQPVFDAIVKSGASLFSGAGVAIALPVDGQVRIASIADEDLERCERWKASYPFPLTRDYMHATAILDRRVIDVPDALDPPAEWGAGIKNFVRTGYRALTIMPLMRGDTVFGTVSVVRVVPGPLTDKQIAILKTFADQAVIAIENVRLFNETKEALERQTATAEILKVIANSPSDVQPVFDSIARSAKQLLGGHSGSVRRVVGDSLHLVAFTSTGAAGDAAQKDASTVSLSEKGSLNALAVRTGKPAIRHDIETDPDIAPEIRELMRARGSRSNLAVPMLRDGASIGTINVTRKVPGTFSNHQIQLLETFASQAVIAIDNVRLFNETKEALERQTATSEVLRVISSSPTDVQPVFDSIAERAAVLCGARFCSLSRFDGESIHMAAVYGATQEGAETIRAAYPMKPGGGTLAARVIRDRRPLHIADVQEDPNYEGKEAAAVVGFRSVLGVPMMREGHLAGAIVIAREQAGLFPENQVSLLTTFADQAVIAIENVRLFHEIEEKGRQLEVASQHKSNFLASMSHELRTPLNAILGFNEMILGQVYGEVPKDMQEPLADIQASGKHLLRLINNVLDLAKIEAGRMELSLQEYSVHDTVATVHSTLRPLAAEKGLEFLATVPNDMPLAYGDGGRMAQCLMNLAGNSLKFTKSGKVEISAEAKGELLVYKVTDTGIGIPPDKIDSLFTEFKQTDATIASEYGGTGLGLSISRKFVEMHGGRIWVESELGKGSAFIIEIPLRVKTT